jgi:hypothetical protein
MTNYVYAPKGKQREHHGRGCEDPAQHLSDVLHTFDVAFAKNDSLLPRRKELIALWAWGQSETSTHRNCCKQAIPRPLRIGRTKPTRSAHSVFPLENGSLFRSSREKEVKLRERKIVSMESRNSACACNLKCGKSENGGISVDWTGGEG